MTSTQPNATQRANLERLAAYLAALPIGYERFDMMDFAEDEDRDDVKPADHPCATVMCAVGHGPSAGVEVSREDGDWSAYCARAFGIDYFDKGEGKKVFTWLFESWWSNVDNTPHGAAARIRHYLRHGVPEDWEEQMNGTVPLCYVGMPAEEV